MRRFGFGQNAGTITCVNTIVAFPYRVTYFLRDTYFKIPLNLYFWRTSMPIKFTCQNPTCQNDLKVGDEHIGKKVRCPHCGTINTVPTPEESVSLPPLDPSFRSRFEDIIKAAGEGSVDDVRYFVEKKGINVNTRNNDGATPLNAATMRNSNLGVLNYLISQGADVNVRSNTATTPLFLAVISPKSNKVETLECLIARGADVNVKDNQGRTPLHYAADKFSDIEALKCLIAHSADVNVKDNRGATPLHIAASCNPNVEILETLVFHSADVNVKDNKGCTPLLHAVGSNPNVEILKYLISKGADVNAKDNDGDTALAYARSEEKREKRRILLAAGAHAGSSSSDSGGSNPSGCLVFLAALGGLFISGVCGLAFFIATVWKF